jgi:RNA polymerase sigma-70 factor (ECF subfamily)
MTNSDPDVAFMLRVKRGDRDAFRQLVERHQRSVINVVYRAIGDAWEAEDIAQRVFVQVYRAAPRYRPKAKFTTWLFTITHNAILNEKRRRARHAAESLEALGNADAAGAQLPDMGATDPATEAAERELQLKILEAIRQLPDAQRTAVILCRYEGQSYEEISRVLGCSVAAVKSLLHRARETLKERLRGCY